MRNALILPLLLALPWMLPSTGQVVAAETITLRGDDWLPYNTAPTAAKPGFLIEIAKAVWEPHGFTIDYQLAPWARAVKDTQGGSIDVLVGAGEADKDGVLFTSIPQAHSDNHFFTLASSTWTFADPSSLDAITLGVVKDYTYLPFVDERVASKKKVIEATGDRPLVQLIKLLEAKRVDALIENKLVLAAALQNDGKPEALRDAGTAGKIDNIYLGMSAKRPHAAKLLALLEVGMAEMAKDGRLPAIYARYGITSP